MNTSDPRRTRKVSGYMRVVFTEENVRISQVHLMLTGLTLSDYFAINTNINNCVVLPRLADAQHASGEGVEK